MIRDVRFCSSESRQINTITNKEERTERPIYGGIMSFFQNTVVDFIYFKAPIVNRSMVIKPHTGAMNSDGTFTGCVESVHNNESDIIIGMVRLPIDDYDH